MLDLLDVSQVRRRITVSINSIFFCFELGDFGYNLVLLEPSDSIHSFNGFVLYSERTPSILLTSYLYDVTYNGPDAGTNSESPPYSRVQERLPSSTGYFFFLRKKREVHWASLL